MTVVQADVKHKTQTAKADDPDYDVSADEWNEGHNVTVGVPSDIGTANAEGSSTELARKDHVHNHPSGLGADLHHAKYTDAEAISAVEGEATLDLTGVIPDSAYPNALLQDGSRDLIGDWLVGLTDGNITIRPKAYWLTSPYPKVYLGTSSYPFYSITTYIITASLWGGVSSILFAGTNSSLQAYTGAGSNIAFYTRYGGTQMCARLISLASNNGAFEIQRGGDITMLAAKMLTIGVYSDATRPAAGTAGRMIFNTTDANLNIDDGTNWILPDGTQAD